MSFFFSGFEPTLEPHAHTLSDIWKGNRAGHRGPVEAKGDTLTQTQKLSDTLIYSLFFLFIHLAHLLIHKSECTRKRVLSTLKPPT